MTDFVPSHKVSPFKLLRFLKRDRDFDSRDSKLVNAQVQFMTELLVSREKYVAWRYDCGWGDIVAVIMDASFQLDSPDLPNTANEYSNFSRKDGNPFPDVVTRVSNSGHFPSPCDAHGT